MDLYILNSKLERIDIVEEFFSLIWTHRYSNFGDCQLDLLPTRKNRLRLREGVYLGVSFTKQVMEIDEVYITEDEDGSQNMKVTARSMGTILEDRIVTPNWLAPEEDDRVYYKKGPAATVAKTLLEEMCVLPGAIDETDVIPGFEVVNSVPSSPEIEIALKPDYLFKSLKDIWDEHGIGFRIDYDLARTKPLRLTQYKGVDRPLVEFSSELDNLAQESYLNSDKGFKNVAYVMAKKARWVQVYANGANLNTSGLNRKVLIVDASDIDDEKVKEPKLTAILKQRGLTALKDHRKKRMMDGVITNYSQFTFGAHYNLGDTIYIKDDYGRRAPKVVAEYIWVMDEQGFRSYPTFAS